MNNLEQEIKELPLQEDSPTRRPSKRKTLNSLDRGSLVDKLRGSAKFKETKHDLGIINNCLKELQVESETYKLKPTKPK